MGSHFDLLKWGLLPHWTKEPTRAKRPIDAGSTKKAGMFRGALSQRRCIVT
jgi:putative SOS response-associated peptidase YedK